MPAMFAGPEAPAAPHVGQFWRQTGVKLETVLRRPRGMSVAHTA
jgi:hypothetical protein